MTPNQPVVGSWHAPDLGEHTKIVLTGMLGYSEEETKDMMREGGASPPPAGIAAPKQQR